MSIGRIDLNAIGKITNLNLSLSFKPKAIAASSIAFGTLSKDAFTISGLGVGGTYIGNIPFLRIDYIWHD